MARLVDRLTPVIQARVGQVLLCTDPSRHSRQNVEDLTQEIFLILFRDDAKILRDWHPERGLSLENFVGMVARKRACSKLRSGRGPASREEAIDEERPDPPSVEADPERRAAARESVRWLLDRLRQDSSPLGWHLFELLYRRELEVGEVCRITGLGPDAVYQWRSRLRRKIAQLLAELDDDGKPAAPNPQ